MFLQQSRPLAAAVGVVLVLARKAFPKIVHAGLKMFYGEPLADATVRSNAGVHVVAVGMIFVVVGLVVTALAFT